MALDRAKLKARLVGIDTSAIRERVLREQQERKEVLDWYEHQATWRPELSTEEARQREGDIEKNNLPF